MNIMPIGISFAPLRIILQPITHHHYTSIILCNNFIPMEPFTREPFKILKTAAVEAAKINKQLGQYTTDFAELRHLTEKQQQAVRLGIENSRHRNQIFRKLEEEDRRRREDILEQLEKKTKANILNKQRLLQKRQKQARDLNSKVAKVYNRHQEDQISKEQEQQQEALEARQQRAREVEQKQRENINRRRQRRSYDRALEKMRMRDRQIQQFANETSQKLSKSARKFYGKMNPEHEQAKMEKMRRYMQVMEEKRLLARMQADKILQRHCSSLEEAKEMVEKKRSACAMLASRIQKFNKQKFEKVRKNKSYIEQELNTLPQKCEQRLNNSMTTSRSGKSTRNSSFVITSKTWRSESKAKRQYMRSIQQNKSQDIIEEHLSATLRNKGKALINNKFIDLKLKAAFNAQEFL